MFKSVWDGWEHQVGGHYHFGDGYDAVGWLYGGSPGKNAPLSPETVVRLENIVDYLRKNYFIPPMLPLMAVLVYANDDLQLPPERFREIDRIANGH